MLAVLLMLSGCGSNAQVAALRADPMGEWTAPGLREAREYVTEPGTPLGKPRYAELLRILEVRDGTDVASVLSEARDAAEDAGWSVRFEHDDGAFSAEKAFTVEGEELRGTLSVGRQDIGRGSGGPEIFLALHAYPA